MKYYRIEDDIDLRGRWYLNGLYDSSSVRYDSRDLVRGHKLLRPNGAFLSHWNRDEVSVVSDSLNVQIRHPGRRLDFTFADSDMPVLSKKAASIFARMARDSIELIGIEVEGTCERFEIMNVTRLIDCIDVNESVIQWYQVGNDVRPDLAGSPEMITKLCINHEKALPHHVLRIKGWEIAVIVSELIKNALESAHVSGVVFSDVTPNAY